MPRCIYCQQDRSAESYTKAEHVLPQSFGKFRQNLTLHGVVCDACNQYFGDNLETYLARDTLEGQMRFERGLKAPKDFKTVGRKSRMVLKSAEGEFAGCYMKREYSKERDKIVVNPLPQVGFMLGTEGKYEYFLLDEIPTKTELDEKGFQKRPHAIIGLAVDPEEMARLLEEKGIPFALGGPLEPGDKADTILCELEGTIDPVILRAIAKIAFNYLAYVEGAEFVQHRAFDKARRYIRWDHAPGYKLVFADEEAILADESVEGFRRDGHLIAVNWAQDGISVLAHVSLMNWLSYRVSLARDFTGPPPELRKGHFFNAGGLDIHKLGTRRSAEDTPPLTSR